MLQIVMPVLSSQPETTQTLYCRPVRFCLLITQNTGEFQSTYSIVTYGGERPGTSGKMLQIVIPVLLSQPQTTQTLYCRVLFCLLILQNTGKYQSTYIIVMFGGDHPGTSGKMLQIIMPVLSSQPETNKPCTVD